jgi:hypothetical protein
LVDCSPFLPLPWPQANAWGDPLNFLAPVTGLDVRALAAAQQAAGAQQQQLGGGAGSTAGASSPS